MKKITCVVQEHQFSNLDIKNMELGMKEIYQQNYMDDEKLLVTWLVAPKMYAFAERKPSQAVIIMVEVDEDITREKREKLMSLYSRFLLEKYNVSPLDLVITVADSSYVNQFFEAQQARVDSNKRFVSNMKIAGKAIASRIKHGYWALSSRL